MFSKYEITLSALIMNSSFDAPDSASHLQSTWWSNEVKLPSVMAAIALFRVSRFLLSHSRSGKYMLPCSSCEELLGTEKADPTDKR